MLESDSEAGLGIANAVAQNAKVNRLGDPVAGNTLRKGGRDTTCASGSLSTVSIDVAGEVRLVLWVTNKNHTLNSVECSTGELGESVAGGSGTLGVAFEDEACGRVGCEGGLDLATMFEVAWAEFWSKPAA